MANRFFTIMIVPEKTSEVRRVVVPSWLAKGALVGMFFVAALATLMILDYWYVMNQIAENNTLKIENRRLRQQVQIFKTKVGTLESTMDRIKTFTTRLKVITNVEERGTLAPTSKLPDAATNIGTAAAPKPTLPEPIVLAAAQVVQSLNPEESPEDRLLRQESDTLDQKFSLLTQESLLLEQNLQDLYELLADQKSFLAARPTRMPAVGYFTSGFGIRRSPFGDKIKMHEGLDVANHPGTPIRATADGMILFANSKSGYGQTVVIDHGYGLETWYGHARKLLVKKGQKIRRGEQIALLGSSGGSTGPHVHYEVRVHGNPVDPLSYILEN